MEPIGFINLNKPTGITSHGAAQKLKKIIGIRRIGHSGTLDPMASGVLVMAIGKATKLVEFLRKDGKTYEAVIRLGLTSDTYDATGEITETPPPVPIPSGAQIKSALEQFTGEIEQMPPKFSAIKVKGTPAHRLARQGKEVKLEPRQVNIKELKLIEFRHPLITVKVTCSAGTYIRSLAHDLGQRLKTGAVLQGLHRTHAGEFDIKDSVELDSVTQENWEEYLLPVKTGIGQMPTYEASPAEAKKIASGIKIPVKKDLGEEKIAIFGKNEELLAIGEYNPETKLLKPAKVLAAQAPLPPKKSPKERTSEKKED